MLEILEKIIENNFSFAIFIIASAVVLVRIIDIVYKKAAAKSGKSLHGLFLKNILKAFIIITAIIKVLSMIKFFQTFYSTILMSSSLLVVVMGFVLQEGLSNVIHGFMISIFKPFDVGDRIEINLDGTTVSGLVKNINLRHTVITTTADNANLIIPNAKIDSSTFKNYSNGNEVNKYPLIIDITYEDGCNKVKREKAKEIIRKTILDDKRTVDIRTDKTKPLFVKTEFMESSVRLKTLITTNTFEENYEACSEISDKIIDEFTKAGIHFAYPHIEISGYLEKEKQVTQKPVQKVIQQNNKKKR